MLRITMQAIGIRTNKVRRASARPLIVAVGDLKKGVLDLKRLAIACFFLVASEKARPP